MAVFKISENDNMLTLVDDDGRVYSFSREWFLKWVRGEMDEDLFFGTRLATEDGFFQDLRFDVSKVYFMDRQERIDYEDAVDIIGSEEEVVPKALASKQETNKRIEKKEKYSDLEF